MSATPESADRLINVDVPPEFIRLCHGWAGDMDCMLRAIDSTGGLTIGTIRPYYRDPGRYLTDQEWHISLFRSLSCDIRYCIRMAEKSEATDVAGDLSGLRSFEQWADNTTLNLRNQYGLNDSDVV